MTIEHLERIALFGTPPEWVETEDICASATSGRKLVDDVEAKRAKIDAGPGLNDDGKRRRLARVVRDVVAELRQAEAHRDTLAGEVADAKEPPGRG